MDKVVIPSTNTSPEIILDPQGIIQIKGRSMSSNVKEFSDNIEEWIEQYLSDPAEVTYLTFNLEYLSTNNLKFYHALVKQFNEVLFLNKKCIINWMYEEDDMDMLEKGEDLSSSTANKFNFIVA